MKKKYQLRELTTDLLAAAAVSDAVQQMWGRARGECAPLGSSPAHAKVGDAVIRGEAQREAGDEGDGLQDRSGPALAVTGVRGHCSAAVAPRRLQSRGAGSACCR